MHLCDDVVNLAIKHKVYTDLLDVIIVCGDPKQLDTVCNLTYHIIIKRGKILLQLCQIRKACVELCEMNHDCATIAIRHSAQSINRNSVIHFIK